MRRRHHFGANSQEEFRLYTATTDYGVGAAPAPARRAPTVTGQAQGLISLAAQPVRWGVRQVAGVAHFLGNTLSGLANKL